MQNHAEHLPFLNFRLRAFFLSFSWKKNICGILIMEGHDHNLDISISGGGAAGASRWNPTKDQIDMLESLYKQGVRTPSAEQIQQITKRLRAFGHIEGKNVFYWFQNHKARQRQKQKQDSISYFNRFHKPSVLPPCPNVICGPYYTPYPEMGFCQQQQPKVLLTRSFKRRPILPEKLEKNKLCGRSFYEPANQEYNAMMHLSRASEECMKYHQLKQSNQETLDLFPLQPSGNLQSRTTFGNSSATVLSTSATKCIASQGGSDDHPFFDFLCGNGSCNSH